VQILLSGDQQKQKHKKRYTSKMLALSAEFTFWRPKNVFVLDYIIKPEHNQYSSPQRLPLMA
jgi:hypothetical protein